ncbi:hypothetical protein ACFSKL_01635 [Belliella marina]|uniref:Uncharacterized protein n=1 Tax=Belliella marina TaxID=1644146 RepID=A0ABW4VFS8_9BACT
MKRVLASLFTLLFSANHTFAQEELWGDPIEIKIERISQVSLDNQGYLFIANQEGNIFQYSEKGEFVNNFSPSRQGKIDQIEAAWTVNIFTFSMDLQEFRILDRFLNPISENKIQQNGINLARAATLGNNNIIWIYDESDFSLNQFDHRRNQVLQKQPLNMVLGNSLLQIQEIKEYQNLVFLKIKDEDVVILDNQANLIKKIDAANDCRLSFWKNNLLSVKSNKLRFKNFQDGKTQEFPIPEYLDSHQVTLSNRSVVFYDPHTIYIFPKKDSPIADL